MWTEVRGEVTRELELDSECNLFCILELRMESSHRMQYPILKEWG